MRRVGPRMKMKQLSIGEFGKAWNWKSVEALTDEYILAI